MTRSAVARATLVAVILSASDVFAQNVTADLSDVDTAHGLERVDVADGDTIPVTLAGLRARQNADPADDHYVYFDVADSRPLRADAAPRSTSPSTTSTDPGAASGIQYDSTAAPYRNSPAIDIRAPTCGRSHTVVLRDVLFANRQNSGADFRVAAPPGATFDVDLVYVRIPGAHMPAVRIRPPSTPTCGRSPGATSARSGRNGSDAARARRCSAARTTCSTRSVARSWPTASSNINGSNVALSLEVPVLKETSDCPSGQACFNSHVGRVGPFRGAGRAHRVVLPGRALLRRAHVPQAAALQRCGGGQPGGHLDAARARALSPRADHRGGALPGAPGRDLGLWLAALHAACAAHGVPVMDFFVLDHDWAAARLELCRHPPGATRARSLAIPFGVLFWASNKKNSTTDTDWQTGLTRQGRMYRPGRNRPRALRHQRLHGHPTRHGAGDRRRHLYAFRPPVHDRVRSTEGIEQAPGEGLSFHPDQVMAVSSTPTVVGLRHPDALLGWMESLADPTRLRLLRLLERHELGVAELCDILQLPQSTVSRHLKVLGRPGLGAAAAPQGTTNLYRMDARRAGPAARRLWLLAREQTEGWATVAAGRAAARAPPAPSASRQPGLLRRARPGEWDQLRGELYGRAFTSDALLALLPSDWSSPTSAAAPARSRPRWRRTSGRSSASTTPPPC